MAEGVVEVIWTKNCERRNFHSNIVYMDKGKNLREGMGHERRQEPSSWYVGTAAIAALVTPGPAGWFLQSRVLNPSYFALFFWFFAAAVGLAASIQLWRKGQTFWQRIIGGLFCAIHLGSLLILSIVRERA